MAARPTPGARVAIVNDAYGTTHEGVYLSSEGGTHTIRRDDGSRFRNTGRVLIPKMATERECPSAAGSTHHMVPSGPARARVMRCAYCKMTQKEIES